MSILSVPNLKNAAFARGCYFVAKNKDYRHRDSYILGYFDELGPSGRYSLLSALEREFGESYPLANRIRLLYDMPRQGRDRATTAKQRARVEELAQKATIRPDTFRLPPAVTIVVVNSLETLVEELPLILQERVLGWDCELFDPISCHVPPATIQISGRERTWVVDELWLRDKETQRTATGLFALFTQNARVYHAFMGSCDVGYLKAFRHMKCFAFQNTLDIETMAKGVGMKQTSLSLYSAFFLGAPLDKSRTMSDWNQRPLEAKELYYAALDAYATRAVAVECMHMVLGEASAIPIKERIKAFENEKGRTMERKMDEKEEDFEKRKENTVRDILRFGILASEADQNKYSTICSGFEL
ncbi:hypothetical protein WA577_002116 [Blastocystis sp. JDR]